MDELSKAIPAEWNKVLLTFKDEENQDWTRMFVELKMCLFWELDELYLSINQRAKQMKTIILVGGKPDPHPTCDIAKGGSIIRMSYNQGGKRAKLLVQFQTEQEAYQAFQLISAFVPHSIFPPNTCFFSLSDPSESTTMLIDIVEDDLPQEVISLNTLVESSKKRKRAPNKLQTQDSAPITKTQEETQSEVPSVDTCSFESLFQKYLTDPEFQEFVQMIKSKWLDWKQTHSH